MAAADPTRLRSTAEEPIRLKTDTQTVTGVFAGGASYQVVAVYYALGGTATTQRFPSALIRLNLPDAGSDGVSRNQSERPSRSFRHSRSVKHFPAPSVR